MKFYDELEFIFGETIATSQYQWTPALGVPFEPNGKNTIDDVPLENIELNLWIMSIPDCVKILKSAKKEGLLNGQ